MISSVPPRMRSAGAASRSWFQLKVPHSPESAVMSSPSRSAAKWAARVRLVAKQSLAIDPSGPGGAPDLQPPHRSRRERPGGEDVDRQTAELLPGDRVVAPAEMVEQGVEPRRADRVHGGAPAVRRDRPALVHESCDGNAPAAVHLAQALRVVDADVIQEHLIELGATGHLPQRSNRDTGQ